MPDYHRSYVEGGVYFFTIVTFNRLPIFTNEHARMILRQVWNEESQRRPFKTIAVCLLPDHLHCIWKLPEGDANYPMRWREVKRRFTMRYLVEVGTGKARNESRQKQQEAAIWQRRYWEHTLLDQKDLEKHVDYIHYNPVKHGFVSKASEWSFSSFDRYVKEGIYEPDWAGEEGGRIQMLEWE